MRLSAPLYILAIAGSVAVASKAHGQTMIDGSNVEAIANIARGYGSATIQTDGAGDPNIVGRIDGTQYVINFYGCTGGKDCTTIQFRASWRNSGNVTLADMNAWNQEKRFGKAYLDEGNAPNVEWDVNLLGGVSVQNLDDTFDWWKIVMQSFLDDLS